jgi:hypothetical protein
MATVTVCDETFPGGKTDELTLEFLTERVTVRELIRARVYQTVREHQARGARREPQRMQPTLIERLLNGPTRGRQRRLDWEHEYERALQAFQKNGFLLLIDGRQVDDLDAEIELRAETQVTFLRLTPLAGG